MCVCVSKGKEMAAQQHRSGSASGRTTSGARHKHGIPMHRRGQVVTGRTGGRLGEHRCRSAAKGGVGGNNQRLGRKLGEGVSMVVL